AKNVWPRSSKPVTASVLDTTPFTLLLEAPLPWELPHPSKDRLMHTNPTLTSPPIFMRTPPGSGITPHASHPRFVNTQIDHIPFLSQQVPPRSPATGPMRGRELQRALVLRGRLLNVVD